MPKKDNGQTEKAERSKESLEKMTNDVELLETKERKGFESNWNEI